MWFVGYGKDCQIKYNDGFGNGGVFGCLLTWGKSIFVIAILLWNILKKGFIAFLN